jgi:3-dehydroquinate synthase
MAADLSSRLGWIAAGDAARAAALVQRAGLPLRPPQGMTAADFLRLMARDKKVASGRLRLVLLREIGEAQLTADFDPARLAETLQAFCAPPSAAGDAVAAA